MFWRRQGTVPGSMRRVVFDSVEDFHRDACGIPTRCRTVTQVVALIKHMRSVAQPYLLPKLGVCSSVTSLCHLKSHHDVRL